MGIEASGSLDIAASFTPLSTHLSSLSKDHAVISSSERIIFSRMFPQSELLDGSVLGSVIADLQQHEESGSVLELL